MKRAVHGRCIALGGYELSKQAACRCLSFAGPKARTPQRAGFLRPTGSLVRRASNLDSSFQFIDYVALEVRAISGAADVRMWLKVVAITRRTVFVATSDHIVTSNASTRSMRCRRALRAFEGRVYQSQP